MTESTAAGSELSLTMATSITHLKSVRLKMIEVVSVTMSKLHFNPFQRQQIIPCNINVYCARDKHIVETQLAETVTELIVEESVFPTLQGL